ncbi:MAG: HPr family phosphocarrier protein [Gammaproteobacteria bacterium]|jgi:phosphocarrier protein|nr:HPr family phosphocarrier protein [Gammaproteobacteria bacterium]
MVKRDLKIINKLGMHARAAAKFVNLASSFGSDVELGKGDRMVNGKSIMGVMMLAASRGTSVSLRVEGNDEVEAADKLEELVRQRFGEDE